MTGVSTAFGTFGELLQGVLPGGDDFLVTLPIARWSVATFRSDPTAHSLRVVPAHKSKARRLVSMILADGPGPTGGVLVLDSTLPEGKGFASSSADLVATARAVDNALGLGLPPSRVESYLRRIEPTDGVLYDGIVAYDHRRVELRRRLGTLRPMSVVGVDEGGVVDTVAFNRLPKPFSAADRREYERLLTRLTAAVAEDDLAEVGAVATRSAQLNQALRPKRTFHRMIELCEEVGGLGVVIAHSGTSLGVLLDRADPHWARKVVRASRGCVALARNVTTYTTLSFRTDPAQNARNAQRTRNALDAQGGQDTQGARDVRSV
ncbi:kinase [Streptomyces tubbatahanensis]|uniref:Kinase n=2 Tax=Streptomyces tubbatahanensis TaxID=2923272 RepID=A0ABY3Y3M2_9ACTN|nr:kinase [Streptomyces tubbatahanensis]UNT00819.1 kinase [Streptomyces tubbatahanensis]